MRLISVIIAAIVALSLYFLIVDRKSLISFIEKFQNEEKIESNLNTNKQILEKNSSKNELPFVIVKKSIAKECVKKGSSVALMIDQRVTEGSKVNFFGKAATTTTIPAQLIKKYGCKRFVGKL